LLERRAFRPKFPIVALCGSMGALRAYVRIFRDMPRDTGMAFVVLTHRRKDRPCQLAKILSQVTQMPVQQIENGWVLKPNCVYIIPPGTDLTTDGTAFWLAPMSTVYGWPDGFDIFLKSLARSTKDRALTVILSGMAADGSAALAALRDSGGICFAQNDAEYSGMPSSAIATGKVDHIGSAAEIAALLSDHQAVPLS
jgi:two-component system, chemotaxis family, CheB/CheR fusion protein